MKKEVWDEVDALGDKTGRIVNKIALPNLRQVVDIWIFNHEGKILLQKRADCKRVYPGLWAETGGGIIHGETSLQAIHREVYEEIGVEIDDERCELIMKFRTGFVWNNAFFLRQDIDLQSLVLKADEVSDIGWFTIEEIDELVKQEKFIPYRWEFVREICRLYAKGINISTISYAK